MSFEQQQEITMPAQEQQQEQKWMSQGGKLSIDTAPFMLQAAAAGMPMLMKNGTGAQQRSPPSATTRRHRSNYVNEDVELIFGEPKQQQPVWADATQLEPYVFVSCAMSPYLPRFPFL